MGSAYGVETKGSVRAAGLSRFAGGCAAAVCSVLLIGLVVRSSLPILSIVIVPLLGWIVWRSLLASAYLLLATAPLQSIGLRHLSFSLVDAVLVLFLLKTAFSVARGARPKDLFGWPSGPFGIALGAFLLLTSASGVIPAIRLVGAFLDAGWMPGILSISQAIFAGTMNPLGELWHHAAVAFLFLHLAGRPLEAGRPRGLARVVVPAAALLGLVALVERTVGAHWGYQDMTRMVGRGFTLGRMPGLFSWPTQFATYLDLILPIVLALAVVRARAVDESRDPDGRFNAGGSWSRGRTVWLAIAGGLGIVALFLTLTRSGWMGLLLSSVAVIALGFRGGESRRRLALAAVLLGALLVPLTFELWTARTELEKLPGGRQEDGGRMEYVWPTAIHMIQAHPFLGCGLGMWRTASRQYAPYALTESRSERVHAHNVFLQVASESGLPAALALFLLLVQMAWRLWRRSKGGDPLWVGLAATFPGYGFHGMLEDALFPPELFLSFWVFVLLAMAKWNESRTAAISGPGRRRVRG